MIDVCVFRNNIIFRNLDMETFWALQDMKTFPISSTLVHPWLYPQTYFLRPMSSKNGKLSLKVITYNMVLKYSSHIVSYVGF